MIVYIQGGTILNTQDSDCLPIPHVTSRLRSSPPKRCSVSSPSLSNQIGCGSVTPRPTCSHKPIPPKRLKDKLNLMPCNKLSRLLCTVRHCVSGGSGALVHFLYLYGNHEPTWSRAQTTFGRGRSSTTSVKLETLVKHLRLRLMN